MRQFLEAFRETIYTVVFWFMVFGLGILFLVIMGAQ